ncbi:MAG: enoyl-CoA hydratase-related protein [Pseudomonadota bacterium]
MRSLDTGTEELICTVADHVATVTLNRPAKRNAMSPELLDGLSRALDLTEEDADVRVVVLTGAGSAFCAGGDVSRMGAHLQGAGAPPVDDMVRSLRARQEGGTLRIFDHAKPTIAALPGPAAGAGMGVALACDLRVAAPTAALVPAFGAIGLSGDWGGSWLLARLIGPGRAKEVFFTGRRIELEEAQSLGIFNRILPAQDFGAAVQAYAAGIAQGAPVALRLMKENHNRNMVLPLRDAMREEAANMVKAMQTADHRRAAAAFLTKSEVVFEGD